MYELIDQETKKAIKTFKELGEAVLYLANMDNPYWGCYGGRRYYVKLPR